MEKSQKLGTCSCSPQRSLTEAKAALCSISNEAPLKTLHATLSPAPLYLVGGTVRDAFYHNAKTDIDCATSLTAPEVKARCEAKGIRVIDTGIQHGTVLALVADTHVEITTFRVPSARETHHTAHSIETDLQGRDFTINAIAFDLNTQEMIDPFGGIKDIEASILRGVENPEARFVEDPLRILRMIRFGSAQGRAVEPRTLEAAKKHVAMLSKVSCERIKAELDKILMCPLPHYGIRSVYEIGGLPYTIPELIPSVGFEQNKFHIHDVFEHTLWVLERSPADLILRWSAVFHDIGKPHTLSVDPDGSRHFYSHETVSEDLSKKRMKDLRFSTDDSHSIARIVRHHMRPLDCGAPGVRRLIRDLGPDLARWRSFKSADAPPTVPEQEFHQIASRFDALLASEQQKMAGPSYGKLAITGDDLKRIGIKPGPSMGAVLKQLEELVIEDPSKNTKELLIKEAKRRIGSSKARRNHS
jgi:tRNA nucleotidyltransferase (CCA-adding enzyme)